MINIMYKIFFLDMFLNITDSIYKYDKLVQKSKKIKKFRVPNFFIGVICMYLPCVLC